MSQGKDRNPEKSGATPVRKLLFLLIIFMLAVSLAVPGTAMAKKKKSKGAKKKNNQEESYDPYKGRIGLGFSLGGTSGTAGSGFSAGVGISYYFIKYLSAGVTVGYGFAPYYFINEDGDQEDIKVNFVPADLYFHIHPLPGFKLSPYFGPGVGLTYTWYELDNEKVKETWYNAFGDLGATYWVSRNFGLNFGIRYTIPYYEDEWKTDEGQLTYGLSGSVIF